MFNLGFFWIWELIISINLLLNVTSDQLLTECKQDSHLKYNQIFLYV